MSIVADVGARPALPADLPALEFLEATARETVALQRGGAAYLERDLPDWRIQNRLVAGPAVRVFAGTIDDTVVGFAVVAVHGSGLSLAGTIEGIYVEPEARELGVGEALLDAVIAWCRSLGCRALDGTALPGDRATKNFFETFGLVARSITTSRSLVDRDDGEDLRA